MGNFLVSTVCSAHSRSEAAYALVRAQVRALRGSQLRASPLQRHCAAQQAALRRLLSSKLALAATLTSQWAAAATDQAKTALVTCLVVVVEKLLTSLRPQLIPARSDEDEDEDDDDVLDEFNAVFEPTFRLKKTTMIRELQRSNKKVVAENRMVQSESGGRLELRGGEWRDDDGSKRRDSKSMPSQSSEVDDEFVVLPKLEDDRDFYLGLNGDKDHYVEQNGENTDGRTEGERLLQLASSLSTASLRVDPFLVSGDAESAEAIAKHVDECAALASDREKKSVGRVLLAYCVYSSDLSYSRDMVVPALEYLRVWHGDEDRAFKSLAVLCNDVPRLCAAFE